MNSNKSDGVEKPLPWQWQHNANTALCHLVQLELEQALLAANQASCISAVLCGVHASDEPPHPRHHLSWSQSRCHCGHGVQT